MEDANKRLNNILLMLFNLVPDYKLVHISTTLKINQHQEHYLDYIADYTIGNSKRSRVYRNNKIKGTSYLLNVNGGIVVTYEKFLIFFLTYMRYIK